MTTNSEVSEEEGLLPVVAVRSDEQLSEHAERLERDLEDLRNTDSEDNLAGEDVQ